MSSLNSTAGYINALTMYIKLWGLFMTVVIKEYGIYTLRYDYAKDRILVIAATQEANYRLWKVKQTRTFKSMEDAMEAINQA